MKFDIRDIDIERTGLDRLDESLALLYHENSKSSKFLARKDGQRIGAFLGNPMTVERSVQPFKNYPYSEVTRLESYTKVDQNDDFLNELASRKSKREFDNAYRISLAEIYKILNYSYGFSRMETQGNITQKYRMVPSAGALYPLEIYFYANNSALEQGIYHYNPNSNVIENITPQDFDAEKFLKSLNGAQYVQLKDAAMIVMITSVIERQIIKYGDRAYRFMLMEAGFVTQNMSLVSGHIGLGSCMLGSYFDDEVNDYLGVNGVGETVQNVLVIGK